MGLAQSKDYWSGAGPSPQRGGTGTWTNVREQARAEAAARLAQSIERGDVLPRHDLLRPPDDYFYGGSALPQRGGTGTWTNEYGNDHDPWMLSRGMVRNVSVMSQAPIPAIPGDTVTAYSYSFDYKGPAKRLVLGWALKPQTGPFGDNWNNGDSAMLGGYAFSGFIPVASSPDYMTYTRQDLSLPIVIPHPGSWQLRGGSFGTINEGDCSTWMWITDGDWAVAQDSGTPASLMNDDTSKHLFLIDSPNAPVIRISGGQAARNLALVARRG